MANIIPMNANLTVAPSNDSHIKYWRSLGAELIWIQNSQGLCESFNWPKATDFGLNATQAIGVQISSWLNISESEALEQAVQRVQDFQRPEQLTLNIQTKKDVLSFAATLMPLPQTDERAGSLLAIAYPLTADAGEDIEHPLPKQSDPYQKVLTKIARKIRSTLDLVAIRQEAVSGLGQALDVSRCLLLSYNDDHELFKVEGEYRQPGVKSVLGVQWEAVESPRLAESIQSRVTLNVSCLTKALSDSQAAFVVPTLYQNKVNGFICLQQCEHERQWSEAERELTQELAEQLGTAIAHATLYQALEEANKAATEASRLKSDFLASTTHELRTPLNGIIGFLKLVLDDMADDREEELEFIEEAHKSAIHLLNLINDILDIAKIESGKIDVELDAISLSELLENVDNFARPQTQSKSLSWEIIAPNTYDDIILYADYQRTFQVLLNLVSNALKFTHEGGITVSVELVLKDIKLDERTFPGMVKIKVEDTGIGVALDMQEKLFKSFSQVKGGHTRQYAGTGLGLAISKKLVEAIGGKISFYSMGEGLGSSVTFSIPLNQKPLLKNDPTEDPQVFS